MIHGVSTRRINGYFIHIIGFDARIMKDIEREFFRYDTRSVPGWASFFMKTKELNDTFLKKYKVVLVDNKSELNLLFQLTS